MLHVHVTLLTNDDFFKHLKVDGKRVKSHLDLMNVIGGSKKKKKKRMIINWMYMFQVVL